MPCLPGDVRALSEEVLEDALTRSVVLSMQWRRWNTAFERFSLGINLGF